MKFEAGRTIDRRSMRTTITRRFSASSSRWTASAGAAVFPTRRRRGFEERTLRVGHRWRVERAGPDHARADAMNNVATGHGCGPRADRIRPALTRRALRSGDVAQPFRAHSQRPCRAADRSSPGVIAAFLGRGWKRQVHAEALRGPHGRARDEPDHRPAAAPARARRSSRVDPRPAHSIRQRFDQI